MVMLCPCQIGSLPQGRPFVGDRPARLAAGVPVLPGAACLCGPQGWDGCGLPPALPSLAGSAVT